MCSKLSPQLRRCSTQNSKSCGEVEEIDCVFSEARTECHKDYSSQLNRKTQNAISAQGQKVNAAGDGSPGSVKDPYWNGGADPRWSLDGTRILYFQTLTVAPDCGGVNPLPCPHSTAPGGRT